jgi:hypothetical protein
VLIPDWAPVRAAERKGASNTDSAERVHAIGVRESLVFGCWLLRVTGSTKPPIMMLDASNHRADFGLRETTLGKHLSC